MHFLYLTSKHAVSKIRYQKKSYIMYTQYDINRKMKACNKRKNPPPPSLLHLKKLKQVKKV